MLTENLPKMYHSESLSLIDPDIFVCVFDGFWHWKTTFVDSLCNRVLKKQNVWSDEIHEILSIRARANLFSFSEDNAKVIKIRVLVSYRIFWVAQVLDWYPISQKHRSKTIKKDSVLYIHSSRPPLREWYFSEIFHDKILQMRMYKNGSKNNLMAIRGVKLVSYGKL